MKLLSQLFLDHVGQTSDNPMMIEIERAEGVYMFAPDGKRYMDLISGVSVSNAGHGNRKVVEAVCRQAADYMHLMVYGEFIETPQVLYARKLTGILPDSLDSIYFVNSGSEAIEGALKLAKRFTGRTELIGCSNAYHGSTHGSLSLLGDESFRNSFRPLLPGVRQIRFNNFEDLAFITTKTAAVLIEPVQGEGGFRLPQEGYLKRLRQRCDETGTLLIFDEIQSGFGRTGKWFAFQKFGVTPDIVCMAKAMGGGMPLGGFAAAKHVMDCFKTDPVLGHITTFGGHPVCCAAGLAAFEYIEEENLMATVESKENLFRSLLVHPAIREIRSCGLMMAVDFGDKETMLAVVRECVETGLLTEWFLFCETALRIAPPLVITEEEIRECCRLMLQAIRKVAG